MVSVEDVFQSVNQDFSMEFQRLCHDDYIINTVQVKQVLGNLSKTRCY